MKRIPASWACGTALVCAIAAIGSFAAAGRSQPVVKHVPKPSSEAKVAPHTMPAESSPDHRQQFVFGAHWLTQSVSDPCGAEAVVEVALAGKRGVVGQWQLSRETVQLLHEAQARLAVHAPDAWSRRDATQLDRFETLGQELEAVVHPTDWAVLEEMGRALDKLDRHDIAQGVVEASAAALKLPQKDRCAGAIGKALVSLGVSGACWGTLPPGAGLQAGLCTGLTLSSGSLIMDVVNHCGGGGDGCTCWPIKYCMCCNLTEGEECLCRCGGVHREPCCDWEDGARRVTPVSATRGTPDCSLTQGPGR